MDNGSSSKLLKFDLDDGGAEDEDVQINTVSIITSPHITKSRKIPVNINADKNIGISVEGIK
jgi:hypothetical protein